MPKTPIFQKDRIRQLTDFDIFDDYNIEDKIIEVRCKECNHKWETISVKRGSKIEYCPKCGRVVVVAGLYTVAMQRPDLKKYFIDPIDPYLYNSKSSIKVWLKCPDCGFEKQMTVDKLTMRRFACDVCKDGVSFANKFIYYLLKQINPVWWKTEWHPEWATKYSYDAGFILNGKYYAVEMHGGQHYSGSHWSGVLWEDQQRRDNEKIQLASTASVTVITIDCSKTEFEFVKKNILGSELATLFNLSDIDWNIIAQQCQGNLMKQVCEIYNTNPSLSRQEIGNMVGLAAITVYAYLKDGNALGWCDYNPPLMIETNSKSVNVYDINKNLISNFKSITSAIEYLMVTYEIHVPKNAVTKCINQQDPFLMDYKSFYFELVK